MGTPCRIHIHVETRPPDPQAQSLFLYRNMDGDLLVTGVDICRLGRLLSNYYTGQKKLDAPADRQELYEICFKFFYGRFAKTDDPGEYEPLFSEQEHREYSHAEYDYLITCGEKGPIMSVYTDSIDGGPIEGLDPETFESVIQNRLIESGYAQTDVEPAFDELGEYTTLADKMMRARMAQLKIEELEQELKNRR